MHRIHRGGLALTIFGATPIFLLITFVAWLLAGHAGVEYVESLAASTTAPPWTYKPILPELGLPWALATTPPAILSIICTAWGLHLLHSHNKKYVAFKQAMAGKPSKARRTKPA